MKKKITLMLEDRVARELRVMSAMSGDTQSIIVERGVEKELRKLNKEMEDEITDMKDRSKAR